MLDFHKIYTDLASWIAITVVGGVLGWIVALRRKVNTNEKQIEQDRAAHKAQIELIMEKLDGRDRLRIEELKRNDERAESLESDVREVRKDVADIKTALLGRKD